MIPRKLTVLFCFPSYGGNGGISSEVPDIRRWFAEVYHRARQDERIAEILEVTIADTPITMVRNKFVTLGKQCKADVLVMVDSDMNPYRHKGEPGWREFFSSSFDFLYAHYDKGPCVIGAPYCGPPGSGENVYVFQWGNGGDHGDESPCTSFKLDQYSRAEASKMRGIQPCAALPTGLIMYDMRAFDLIAPSSRRPDDILIDFQHGKISLDQARHELLIKGWFDYEWKTMEAAEKASTEDVQNTRDISFAGIERLGYNPLYCNWDSPAGHWKPWCVAGRPWLASANDVSERYRDAVLRGLERDDVIVDAARYLGQPRIPAINGEVHAAR